MELNVGLLLDLAVLSGSVLLWILGFGSSIVSIVTESGCVGWCGIKKKWKHNFLFIKYIFYLCIHIYGFSENLLNSNLYWYNYVYY